MDAGSAILTDDVHDRELMSRVAPSGWVNPKPARRYNLVVLGAGTAGLVSAAAAAGLGARVALVEKNLMGGDCLNFGCVPSKALIRSARAAAAMRDAAAFGVSTRGDSAEINFQSIMERVRRLRAGISRNDSVERFASLGVDVFLGEGRFVDREALRVGDALLRFKKAVIATGARPALPEIPGLEEAGVLTNETVFALNSLPSRLLVIGGGPIGCELAQAFARLGSRVTLVERESQFLPREDREAAEILAEAFRKDGIDLRLNTRVAAVTQSGSVKAAELITDDKSSQVEFDQVLAGAGRAPNVEGLDLDAAGVQWGRAGIQVNDRLQTTNSRIFAAGDVCLQHRFTHAADASARIVIQNALFFGSRKVSALTLPWCTYTSPEIAHVGKYEGEAQTEGITVTTFKIPLTDVDRAVLDGEQEGFVKIHVRSGTDEILGATIVAEHAGDLISEVSVAMTEKIGLGRLANVIHPYPTQAEGIKKAADAYNRTRLTPLVKRVLKAWFAFSR